MARNQEKAQTMLARWLRFREGEFETGSKRRPYLASQCDSLHKAEKWRGEIIREIGAKVTEIQNGSLGEHRIRDLNDEINKLFREKYHWQRRIVQLGGIDYNKRSYRNKDFQGMTLSVSNDGYMYFGAAKDLPGVRELLSIKKSQDELRRQGKLYLSKDRVTNKLKRTRKEYYEMINGCDYYGLKDDNDPVLIKYEKLQELKARNAFIKNWNEKNTKNSDSLCKDDIGDIKMDTGNVSDNQNNNNSRNINNLKTHTHKRRTRITSMRIPSQKEIDSILLEKRKQMLLEKYATDTPESIQLAQQLQLDEKMSKLKP